MGKFKESLQPTLPPPPQLVRLISHITGLVLVCRVLRVRLVVQDVVTQVDEVDERPGVLSFIYRKKTLAEPHPHLLQLFGSHLQVLYAQIKTQPRTRQEKRKGLCLNISLNLTLRILQCLRECEQLEHG